MAWIYFQELVESDSHSNLGSEPLPIVSVTDTHKAFYCHECNLVTLIEPQYGTTLQPLKQHVCQKSTSSLEDSHQDISVAGRGEGLEGKRSGLFFEIARLVEEISPRFVFLENVPAIRTRGGETVVKTLAALGYDCRWTTLSAASVGANHKRERWFLLANAYGSGRLRSGQAQPKERNDGTKSFRAITIAKHADTWSESLPRSIDTSGPKSREAQKPSSVLASLPIWKSEHELPQPAVVGRNDGVQNLLDRIKCLGNSVVPLQVREAFKKLGGIK